ncbi:MAG: hypothetical protein RIT81_12685 [Deltaproteobacteria bacterium]
MTIELLLGVLAGGVIIGVRAYRAWTVRRVHQLGPGDTNHRTTESVQGFDVVHDRVYVGEEERGSGRQRVTVELWKHTTTVRGALPAWVSFGWSVDDFGPQPDDRNGLWVRLVVGPRPALSNGGFLHASDGELVYDSPIDTSPPSSRLLLGAASSFLRDPPDVVARLCDLVNAEGRDAASAFSILARRPELREQTEGLARRHRDTHDRKLAAEIAAFDRDRETLVAAVNEGGHDGASEIAAGALIETRDLEGLAALRPDRVPQHFARDFLETLRNARHPATEDAALHFLGVRGLTRPALDALAATGGRASIQRLLELERAGLDRDGSMGLEVTIELVRARIAAEVGGPERGRLALASSEDAGALAVVDEGGLALTED